MHVQRDAQAGVVQPAQEFRRLREQLPVPGVAGPAAAVRRVDVDQVPVHVQDGDRERDPGVAEPGHQRQVRLRGVPVVPAPPVAQRVAGQHRHRPGHGVEGLQRGGVVVAVGEHVQVGAADVVRGDPAVGAEQQRLRVVEHGVSAARDDARLQRNRAVGVVQGSRGAAEGRRGLPVPPHRVVGGDAAAHGHAQPAGGERATVVRQMHACRDDLQVATALRDPEVRDRQAPVDGEGRRAVLEDAVLGVLQAQQTVGEHGDAVAVAADHGRRVSDRLRRHRVRKLCGTHQLLTDPAVSPPTM